MMFLSKGRLCGSAHKDSIWIRHYGLPLQLSGCEAKMWLRGRLGFAVTAKPAEEKAVLELEKKSLAVQSPEHDARAKYRLLARCVILPVKKTLVGIPLLTKEERHILIWLRKAGCHRIEELICLFEKRIKPTKDLLYAENRMTLRSKMYPSCVMVANELVRRMEHAVCRNETMESVMRLLHRKRVVIS